MQSISNKLYDYVESLLNGGMDGVTFEKLFSESYDFEEKEDLNQIEF